MPRLTVDLSMEEIKGLLFQLPPKDFLLLAELDQARAHLSFSPQRVRKLSAKRDEWLPEDLEKIEAYTSRFARVVVNQEAEGSKQEAAGRG